jgi:hypothetical protein
LTVSGPGTAGQDQWKPEELELRKRELKQARHAVQAQVAIAVCALVATMVAAYVAIQAAEAVKVAAKGIEQQADAARLSTAISAIGADQAAERVAGFGLLRRHVQDRVNASETPEERLDAYNLYTNALDVLELYLRNPPQAATEAAKEPAAGLGFGRPSIPYDNKYAARELQSLMRLKPEIVKLQHSFEDEPPAPTVDLTEVQLTQQSWEGIDFAWLGGHYFPGIDLRGANLKNSIWGASWLVGAHLQCANLEGANLRGANLLGADLRGAYLKNTDFTEAKLEGVMLEGATLSETKGSETKGLPKSMRPKPGVSRAEIDKGEDGIENCLNYEPYWEKNRTGSIRAPAG